MWLRDSLLSDLPGIQVLLYGYDSDLVDSHSFQSVGDIATPLCAKLRAILNLRRQKSTTETSLLFIAHSLGGIVLKEALVQLSCGDEVERKVASSTYGIMFFGVPHQGMKIEQ